MRFPILSWATAHTPSNTTTEYSLIFNYNFGSGSSNPTLRQQRVPVAMTLRNLQIVLFSGSPPGVGKSWVYTIEKNGVATPLTVTVADNATTGSNTTDVVTFQPGDMVRLALTPVNSPTATFPMFSLLGESLGTDAQPFMVTFNGSSSNTTTMYINPMGGSNTPTVGAANMTMPCSGVFHRIRCDLQYAPTSGKDYTLTLTKNNVNTALSTTVADAATSNENTTDQVRVEAGDVVTMAIIPTNTPTLSGGTYSILFTPDTKGDSIQTYISFVQPSTTVVQYNPGFGVFVGIAPSWDANESLYYLRTVMPVDATITSFYVRSALAPGSGKSYTYRLRDTGVDTAAVATISDLATTANITGINVPISTMDQITVSATPTNTPTTSPIAFGYTLRIPNGNNWSGSL